MLYLERYTSKTQKGKVTNKLDRQCRKCYDGFISILTNTAQSKKARGLSAEQMTFLSNTGRNVRNRVRGGRKTNTSIPFLLRFLIPLALNTRLKVFTCLTHIDSVPLLMAPQKVLALQLSMTVRFSEKPV